MDPAQIIGPMFLFVLMAIVGLELTPEDFSRVMRAPRAVVGGTIMQVLALPILTWIVVQAVGLNPVFGAGAILVATAPGAGISNILAAVGGANVALSVSLTALASVMAVVTLPTVASVSMRFFLPEASGIEVPVQSLTIQLLLSLLLPISLGMWFRAREPEAAVRLAPRLQRGILVVIVVVVTLGVIFSDREQLEFDGSGLALFACVLWTIGAMAIGWVSAWALRLPPLDRFTFLVEFSARNVTVSAIVAVSGLGSVELTFFSALYSAVGYPLVAAAAVLHRRLVASEPTPAD